MPFDDESYFLTVTQLMLPLHALADPVTVTDPAVDPAPTANLATAAAPTKTSLLMCLGLNP
jgi:hypothetical protein